MITGVEVKGHGFEDLMKRIKDGIETKLMVGVPEKNAARGDEGKQKVNNAQLAFIHTYGSPVNNIPARPFLVPAITQTETMDRISELFKQGFEAAIEGGEESATPYLEKAGIVAVNAVNDYIQDSSHFVPNAPETIRRKGSDKPLIDTASLKRSITYVIKRGDE